MDATRTKQCKDCGIIKPVSTDFYKAGTSFQTRCKPCHNKSRSNYRYTYTPRPYKHKTPENIEKIKKLREQNKMKWTKISKELNIPYQSLIQIKNAKSIN